jgi:hypothetical protein
MLGQRKRLELVLVLADGGDRVRINASPW